MLRTGVLQSYGTDLGCIAGLALIGWGIHQWSVPATMIFAGVVVIAVSVLLAIDRKRRPAVKE